MSDRRRPGDRAGKRLTNVAEAAWLLGEFTGTEELDFTPELFLFPAGMAQDTDNAYGTTTIGAISAIKSNEAGATHNTTVAGAGTMSIVNRPANKTPFFVVQQASKYLTLDTPIVATGPFTFCLAYFLENGDAHPNADALLVDSITEYIRMDSTKFRWLNPGADPQPLYTPNITGAWNYLVLQRTVAGEFKTKLNGGAWTTNTIHTNTFTLNSIFGGGGTAPLTQIFWERMLFVTSALTDDQIDDVFNYKNDYTYTSTRSIDPDAVFKGITYSDFNSGDVTSENYSVQGVAQLHNRRGMINFGNKTWLPLQKPFNALGTDDFIDVGRIYDHDNNKLSSEIELPHPATATDYHEQSTYFEYDGALVKLLPFPHYGPNYGKYSAGLDVSNFTDLDIGEDEMPAVNAFGSESQYPCVQRNGDELILTTQRWGNAVGNTYPPYIELFKTISLFKNSEKYLLFDFSDAVDDIWAYPHAVVQEYDGTYRMFINAFNNTTGQHYNDTGFCTISADGKTVTNTSGGFARNVETAGAVTHAEFLTNFVEWSATLTTDNVTVWSSHVDDSGNLYAFADRDGGGWNLLTLSAGVWTTQQIDLKAHTISQGSSLFRPGCYGFKSAANSFDFYAMDENGGERNIRHYSTTDGFATSVDNGLVTSGSYYHNGIHGTDNPHNGGSRALLTMRFDAEPAGTNDTDGVLKIVEI